MKPRVFVSSTYYDLKYLRERIEKFLLIYGFDTVLFESNDVTYEHGKAIDTSVYKELEMCHMMVLIIGGRYGSAISNESISVEQQKRYDEEYVSITKKEFETAVEKNIPIFTFIDKNVYSDFETYNKNILLIDNLRKLQPTEAFQFAHVDSINVFKFINNVNSKPIKTFDKVEEIENYLQSQFSGMFYLYLQSLQKLEDDKRILSSVQELNNVTKLMSEMLSDVGRKVFENDTQEYKKIIDKQFDILLNNFAQSLSSLTDITSNEQKEIEEEDVASFISDLIYTYVLAEKFIYSDVKPVERTISIRQKNAQVKNLINEDLKKKYKDTEISRINANRLNKNYFENVKPFIQDKISFEEKIKKLMANAIYFMI